MEAKMMGEYILECRKKKGLTQMQLAEMINVTDKAVSRWERGVGYPDINLLEPLSKALEIKVSELICGGEAMERVKEKSFDADEVAVSSLEISKKQLKSTKRSCAVSLIISYILMIIGIITSTYYISDLKIRGLMVFLLIVNGVFISNTLHKLFFENKKI
ncbi:MAG: helix-turn-helix transcriptional regulator [Lachnospiraceae bacterium]|nr:helix-turn-helix transcriptional regulator [Lachnospiraceae bacterium]